MFSVDDGSILSAERSLGREVARRRARAVSKSAKSTVICGAVDVYLENTDMNSF